MCSVNVLCCSPESTFKSLQADTCLTCCYVHATSIDNLMLMSREGEMLARQQQRPTALIMTPPVGPHSDLFWQHEASTQKPVIRSV